MRMMMMILLMMYLMLTIMMVNMTVMYHMTLMMMTTLMSTMMMHVIILMYTAGLEILELITSNRGCEVLTIKNIVIHCEVVGFTLANMAIGFSSSPPPTLHPLA